MKELTIYSNVDIDNTDKLYYYLKPLQEVDTDDLKLYGTVVQTIKALHYGCAGGLNLYSTFVEVA